MIGIVLAAYGAVAAATGVLVGKVSRRAGYSPAHAIAHGCMAGFYLPFVAVWAVIKSHQSAIAALRGCALPELPPAPHPVGSLGEAADEAREEES